MKIRDEAVVHIGNSKNHCSSEVFIGCSELFRVLEVLVAICSSPCVTAWPGVSTEPEIKKQLVWFFRHFGYLYEPI